MKENIRKIVEDNTTKKGKYFDYFIQFLILASLIAFTVETLPDNSKKTIDFLNTFEIICVSIFTLEFIFKNLCC